MSNTHDSIKPTLAGSWLDRAVTDSVLLAPQLDAARRANLVPLLPALAWLRFGGRCSRLDARGKFDLVALTHKFCAPLLFLGAGVVVV